MDNSSDSFDPERAEREVMLKQTFRYNYLEIPVDVVVLYNVSYGV